MEYEKIKAAKNNTYTINYKSSTINCQGELGTIEKDACGLLGKFKKENFRGEKYLIY